MVVSDHARPQAVSVRIEGSNPVPSSGESANYRFL
jgi:hypothetical protein